MRMLMKDNWTFTADDDRDRNYYNLNDRYYDDRFNIWIDDLVLRPTSTQMDKKVFVTARRCIPLPEIDKLIYNGLDTVVKWNDGTVTVVHCIDEDEFNPEIGLAMAISRRYFEGYGDFSNPRANFKKTIRNAKHYEPKE